MPKKKLRPAWARRQPQPNPQVHNREMLVKKRAPLENCKAALSTHSILSRLTPPFLWLSRPRICNVLSPIDKIKIKMIILWCKPMVKKPQPRAREAVQATGVKQQNSMRARILPNPWKCFHFRGNTQPRFVPDRKKVLKKAHSLEEKAPWSAVMH